METGGRAAGPAGGAYGGLGLAGGVTRAETLPATTHGCVAEKKTLIPGVASSGWWLLLLRWVELFSTPWTATTRPQSVAISHASGLP